MNFQDCVNETSVVSHIECKLSQLTAALLIAKCNHNGYSYHGILSELPPADTSVFRLNDSLFELVNQESLLQNKLVVYERFPKNGYPLSHSHYTRSKRQKHIKKKIEPKKKLPLKVKKEKYPPKSTIRQQNHKINSAQEEPIIEPKMENQEFEPLSNVSMKVARILGLNSETNNDVQGSSLNKDCTPYLIQLGLGISKYLNEPSETYVAGIPVKQLKMEEYLKIRNRVLNSDLTDVKRKTSRLKRKS